MVSGELEKWTAKKEIVERKRLSERGQTTTGLLVIEDCPSALSKDRDGERSVKKNECNL